MFGTAARPAAARSRHCPALTACGPLPRCAAAPGYQLQQYYINGRVDDCSSKWTEFIDCLKKKTKFKDEVRAPWGGAPATGAPLPAALC